MRNIGSMMMQGLLNSIPIVGLASRLLQVAKYGIKAFRDYFGIKSPSRLMMQMGGHIATGLGAGIEGNARQPLRAMDRMAARVAGAGAMALDGPTLSGGATGAQGRAAAMALDGPTLSGSATGQQARAAAARPAMAAAPITINIHQQPGEDAHALADRVLKLIERKQRGLGAYADDF
jgi:hypothetical protein